jgi:acyl-CoA reductase-like NAD-dependent aldehyde dehydrogenase
MSKIKSLATQAATCAAAFAASNATIRANLLQGLALALEDARTHLVELANEETHLGQARLNGELDRTIFQLRCFADIVLEGVPYRTIADEAVTGVSPAGHPPMVLTRVPLGPVAMFSASNFPFAFSVLGGDTSSALAAGCPVVVKGHPAHPQLSAAVAELARQVLVTQGLPEGLIGHVEEDSHEAGIALVTHPAIQAVSFTGSLGGGKTLAAAVQSRAQPIPFYGELGSVNPIVVMPQALDKRVDDYAKVLATSMTQGAGQFCTSPGLVVMLDSEPARQLCDALGRQVDQITLHPMLSDRIQQGFEAGVAALAGSSDVQVKTVRGVREGADTGFVGVTTASAFLGNEHLRHEVFGSSCLCIMASSVEEMAQVLQAIGGSLTVTLWGVDSESDENRMMVRAAQNLAGRVLFKGVPTGVAVTRAQHHGGPWPSSTQPLFTSVGYAAIDRFLRPVTFQDAPDWVLDRKGVPL